MTRHEEEVQRIAATGAKRSGLHKFLRSIGASGFRMIPDVWEAIDEEKTLMVGEVIDSTYPTLERIKKYVKLRQAVNAVGWKLALMLSVIHTAEPKFLEQPLPDSHLDQ